MNIFRLLPAAFIILALVIFSDVKSQNAYYDAIELKKIFSQTLTVGLMKDAGGILGKYLPDNNTTADKVQAQFLTNPFIPANYKDFIFPAAGESVTPTEKGLFNKLGGLDVTKFANAIADIMIERAKQELTVAFFNRFKKFATKDNPEFQVMFPKTTDNLTNLLTYSYPQMLPALRKGFFDDIKQLTYHLDDVLELPRYRHLLNNFPEVTIAIRSIRLVTDLEDGTSNAADLIKRFAEFKEWGGNSSAPAFKNMGASVKLASIFSESLRHKDATRIWVAGKEVKDLIQDEFFVRIYMALLYQLIKNSDVKFYLDKEHPETSKNLTDIIKEQKDNILLYQNKIAEFINLADKVADVYTAIDTQQKANLKISHEDIYNYINISIDITDYAFSIVKIFEETLVTDQYMAIVKKSNSLYKNIYSEQYTKAVSDAIDIIAEVHDLTEKNVQSPVIAKPAFAEDKDPALKKLLTFIQKVKPYGLFMANMVEAKDDNEVKAALESVILPVGSSSIKKYAKGNISVQTYLGAYWTPASASGSSPGAWSDKFGVTAPVGISWTPGFLALKKAGSFSFFTALFDIGAIVDYKLKKEPDATSNDPNATVISKDYKIQLGQIFSPGIYLVYGSGANLPLSLGFGAQYGPGLSKIKANNNTILTNPSWRWNIFIAVDLPFFNIVNKQRDNQY